MVVFPLLLLAPVTGQPEERRQDPTDGIVAAVLQAYGGREAVGKITSVIAKGKIADFLTGMQGHYARYYERPGKLRIEVMPAQGGEVRILNGERGWQAGPQGFVEASRPMLQSMIYQYSSLDLPMGFADRSYEVKLGGMRLFDGRETYLLLVTLKDAPPLKVFVDVRTSLIARVAADFSMGMMGASELATEYADFRPVEGVLFPHRLINYAGGTKLSEIVLSVIRLNRKIPDFLFSAPFR